MSVASGNHGKTTIGIAAAIFAIAFMQTGNMASSAGFAAMCDAFPGYAPTTLQLALSFPALAGVPVALFAGKFVTWVSKKKLALFACLCFTLGGLGTFFLSTDWVAVLVTKTISGFGFALCSTLATSLLVEYYRGERRGRMIGYKQFVSCGAGMLFSFLGGVLVQFGWQYANLLFVIGFVSFFIIISQLPDTGPVKEDNGDKAKLKLSKTVIYYGLAILITVIATNTYYNSLSLRVVNEGLGTATNAGTAMSIFTIGGLCAGLAFGRLLPVLKRFTSPLFYVGMAVCITTIGFTQSMLVVYICSFIHGFSFYTVTPHQTLIMCDSVPKTSHTLAIAIYAACIYLGMTLSPMIVIPASSALLSTAISSRYIFAGIAVSVFAVYALVKAAIRKNQATGISE